MGDLLLLGLAILAVLANLTVLAVLVFWTGAAWAQVSIVGMLALIILGCIGAASFIAGKGSAS